MYGLSKCGQQPERGGNVLYSGVAEFSGIFKNTVVSRQSSGKSVMP